VRIAEAASGRSGEEAGKPHSSVVEVGIDVGVDIGRCRGAREQYGPSHGFGAAGE